jgi:non-ribosomal peptide synthetase component F
MIRFDYSFGEMQDILSKYSICSEDKDSTKDDLLLKHSNSLTIHGVFEEKAGKDPNKLALITKDGRISYGGLNDRANKLAAVLSKNGIKHGDIRLVFW